MENAFRFTKLKNLVKHTIESGIVPFIWGPPGVGKSSLVREVAQDLGYQYHIVDVPLLQPIDIIAPVPNKESKKIEIFPNILFPLEGKVLICFEDLPHAKPFQMIPCMQILQDRRIGTFLFGEDIRFIATGNREEDLAGTNTVISTVLNRVAHYELVANFEDWKKWFYLQNGLDERVVGFLTAFPDYFSETPREGIKAFPTPRTWEKCARLIYGVSEEEEESLRAYVASTVGGYVANAFMSWVKYLSGSDPIDVIRQGKIEIEDRVKLYATVFSTTQYIKHHPEILDEYSKNISSIFKNLPGDFKTAFLKSLVIYNPDGTIDSTILEKMLSTENNSTLLVRFLNEITG